MGVSELNKGIHEKAWPTARLWWRSNIEKRRNSGARMSCNSSHTCSTIQIRSCVGKLLFKIMCIHWYVFITSWYIWECEQSNFHRHSYHVWIMFFLGYKYQILASASRSAACDAWWGCRANNEKINFNETCKIIDEQMSIKQSYICTIVYMIVTWYIYKARTNYYYQQIVKFDDTILGWIYVYIGYIFQEAYDLQILFQ